MDTGQRKIKQMDFLECKICNVPFDEDDHRPRHAPCGHGLCTACLRALIKDSIYECPKCRQKNKVDVADELPVNYDLIEVIRAFKNKGVPFAKEAATRVADATNDEVCNIHCKSISHWCFKCQMTICSDCLESHNTLLGCNTAILYKAMKSMKEKNIESLEAVVTKFEEDAKQVSLKIKEHADKKKEHLEIAEKHNVEEQKLCNLLESGNTQKEKLIETKKHLNEANSPQSIFDCIKVTTQRKQILRGWSMKTVGSDPMKTLGADHQFDFIMALKDSKKVYVECVIKNEKRHGKLSLQDGQIHFHNVRVQKVEDGCIIMPYDRLQKLIPPSPSLVFVELSLRGSVKGRASAKRMFWGPV